MSLGALLVTAAQAADWPRWRGPLGDGHATPSEKVPSKLPAELKTSWRVPAGPGLASPVVAAGKVFAFGENGAKLASVAIEPGADGDAVVFMADGNEHRIECGRGMWRKGDVAWGGMPARPAAVAGGWEGETFTLRICFVETPFVSTVRLTMMDDDVRMVSEANVGFGAVKQPELVGKSRVLNK